ncbi:putative uncharacterized protein [Parabacteroides sp. CAG:409]|nr:putative uncharacterized protein [Parabacteroides sp. CAG:409]
MDRLKDYIEQHREAFNEEPLPEGHLERFAARLEKEEEEKVKTVPLWRRLMPLAAVVALFLCLSVPFWIQRGTSDSYVCELHSEMGELHTYYRMQLEDHLMELETASKENPSEAVMHLLEAALQIEASCQQFDNQVLPTLPCSDEGIFAINQQYQNSLNSMQILCQQLNRVKEE